MGYMLLAFAFGMGIYGSGTELGFTGGLYHILGNAFMKGGAFLCAGAFLYACRTRNLDEMKGIGRAIPAVGIPYMICILALSGMPPMTGFVSELFICQAGIATGGVGILLVILMLVNIVISLGYYLPSINTILLSVRTGQEPGGIRPVPPLMVAMIIVTATFTLILGLVPQVGLAIVSPAAAFLHGWFPAI
jgi:NADH-quinone oxidoreductase subunit N/multicomponent Na+:H+ antiporter subunit D